MIGGFSAPERSYSSHFNKQKAKIDSMSLFEMEVLDRDAPVGHPFFSERSPIGRYFRKRRNELENLTRSV